MRTFSLRSLAVSLAVVVAALADPPVTDDSPRRIAALIKQLGDDRFEKRQAAAKELEALGEKALPALVEASVASDDLETRRSARRLVRALLPTSRRSRSVGLELVGLDAGEFAMGSPHTEPGRKIDEIPRTVRITRPFFLGAYEVTQEEYEKVMKANPSWFAATGAGKDAVTREKTGRFPVEQVSWFDALEFCNRLSQMDGIEPFYKLADVKREGPSITRATVTVAGGSGYRLPTEAEWEYACRAGSTTPFHYGRDTRGQDANVKAFATTGYGVGGYGTPTAKSLGRTAKVGSYKANRWGLYDMHGGVGEWCGDWYEKDYPAAATTDPKGPTSGHHRVLRGGSWLVAEASNRSASRFWQVPGEKSYYAGFRVARSP